MGLARWCIAPGAGVKGTCPARVVELGYRPGRSRTICWDCGQEFQRPRGGAPNGGGKEGDVGRDAGKEQGPAKGSEAHAC